MLPTLRLTRASARRLVAEPVAELAARAALACALAVAPAASAITGIAHSTYLGGSNNEADVPLGGSEVALAVDGLGNLYVAGTTASADFPTTPGADDALDGPLDLFVTKLDPSGSPVYSTYLGGPCGDVARDVAVDADGNAYVTGRTGSDCPFGGESGVLVAKLDPAGAPLYTAVFGGRLADTSSGQAIAVDELGQAYVTGTVLTSSHDFPTTEGAYRQDECANVYSFAADVFVAKLAADGDSLLYSTIVCGSGDDVPSGIAIDALGTAYVGGATASSDFPAVAALQPENRTGAVAVTGFVFALAPDGSDLVFSTYLGGSTNDTVQGVALDAQRNLFVTGETQSDDFPTTAGVVQEQAGTRHCIQTCTDAFVTKIAAGGGALVYSTYLFGELDDAAREIAVDVDGRAHVVGATSSLYFPLAGAFQTTNRGLADVFVATLAPDASRIVFSTYLGGSKPPESVGAGWDEGWDIALGAGGDVHVAGYTQSHDFPTTPGAAQPALGGGVCDFLGTPCGDVFVTTVAADAAGPVPPVSVSVTPSNVAAGGALQVSWAGITAPTPDDHLRVCALGAPTDSLCAVQQSWPTGAAAGGALEIALPAELAPGLYDVRLMSPDADFYGLLEPIGRSEPIQVAPEPGRAPIAGAALVALALVARARRRW
ncbi:MAG: hypothetical protein DCC71_00790 [Proteobacteria bacterium]|nr:MAG: hypothetical protein DCC71_00790 [Pseudomonadota bacterium]